MHGTCENCRHWENNIGEPSLKHQCKKLSVHNLGGEHPQVSGFTGGVMTGKDFFCAYWERKHQRPGRLDLTEERLAILFKKYKTQTSDLDPDKFAKWVFDRLGI
jgi:hypothetical protein